MSDPTAELPESPGTPPSGSGLPENIAGALSYLLGPITGIVFFILDRDRPFVRFHAAQCLAVTVLWFALAVVLMVLGVILGVIPILGFLIDLLLSIALALAGFALWLWLMYQAYQGETWAFPGLGPYVARIALEAASEGQAPEESGPSSPEPPDRHPDTP